MKGRLTLTARGFGFVAGSTAGPAGSTGGPSVLVPFDHLDHALSGDEVEVEIFPDSAKDKPAGRIVKVLRRNDDPIVGRIRRHGHEVRLYPQANRSPKALVLPDSEIRKAMQNRKLNDGDVVSAAFVDWPTDAGHPIGRPLELVAQRGDDDLELRLIALSRNFPLDFPEPVRKHAAQLSMPKADRLAHDRRDLRNLVCFTIDPDTAKDFDDAMSIRQLENGLLELGVHIADVSSFVEPDDPVDEEAWRRGTSVYLVDTVLPMLPEALSNGVCSLVPGEPRLAMSVIATLDGRGTVHGVDMCESVIKSRRRFTYREAEDIIRGGDDPLAGEIHLLHLLTQTLRRRREEAGSVDLDLPTPQIRLDEDGVPVSVRPSERLDANRMVEECMLLANRLVAEHLESQTTVPGVYRVHDRPRESDIDSLVTTLRDLGVPYRTDGEVEAKDYRRILSFIENFEFRDLIEAVAMKALKKAVYSTENRGHFGLAMAAYTHFTSPIRRYPDLLVHRLLKRSLADAAPARDGSGRGRRRRKGRTDADGLKRFLDRTCTHASERERLATDAEREYSRLKALEFLTTKIGREYDGVVSGVASIGLFVEIERYLIEGLVHISTLGKERFELDRAAYRLVGSKSGTVYRLGDRVRVKVKSVDTGERTADFALLSVLTSRAKS